MKRKITKMGPASLVVSLPSKWVKENNVKKGDEVEVLPENKKLLISLDQTQKTEMVKKFDANKINSIIERQLSMAYKKGYDEIQLTVNNYAQRQRIIDFVPQLIGFEIIDQSEDSIILRNISKDSPKEFNTVFKRTFHTLFSFANELLDALLKDDKSKLKSLISYELLNNKSRTQPPQGAGYV